MQEIKGQLLAKVIERKDFFQSVLFNDAFDDWLLAKELGEFLVSIEPEWTMGHLILTRASRHLGDLKTAFDELEKCQSCSTEANEPEARFLLPLLADETNRLKLAAQT